MILLPPLPRACAALAATAALLVPAVARGATRAVVPAAARVGAWGLEVSVGSSCTGPDDLTLGAADAPLAGTYRACSSLTARSVAASGPSVLLEAGDTVALGNGFAVSAGVDFRVALDPARLSRFASVLDLSPVAEAVYNARFDLRLDELSLAAGDRLDALVAYGADGEPEIELAIERAGGGHVLAVAAREDGGAWTAIAPAAALPLASGWNEIELEWRAGAGTGSCTVAVNGGPAAGLTGLANASRRIESVRWGAVSGALAASSGKLALDGFDSWR